MNANAVHMTKGDPTHAVVARDPEVVVGESPIADTEENDNRARRSVTLLTMWPVPIPV